jgi:hypothetical protein
MLALTFDIDWAPDFVIDAVAAPLLARSLRATWFVTHASPAVRRLAERPDLFELGIHPNFLAGSDHGTNPEEVLNFTMQLVPNAVSVRTHALMQSGPILDAILTHSPVTIDSSLFLPRMSGIRPIPYWRPGTRTLWRIPFFWSDAAEAEREVADWSLMSLLETGPGLKVLDFHPIHVYLNSTDGEAYRRLKESCPRLPDATEQVAATHRHVGRGTGTLFDEVVNHLAGLGKTVCMRDLIETGKGSNE